VHGLSRCVRNRHHVHILWRSSHTLWRSSFPRSSWCSAALRSFLPFSPSVLPLPYCEPSPPQRFGPFWLVRILIIVLVIK
jgi:hypothetical protein